MSNKAINHVWQHSKQRGSALVLMLALADMANDEGDCWPGKTNLGKKCRVGVRQLTILLSRCEASGELVINHRRNGETNQTNLYHINLERVVNRNARGSESQFTTLVNQDSSGSESQFTTLVNQDSSGVVNHDSPNPLSFNPHITHSDPNAPSPSENLILKTLRSRQS